MHLSGVDFEGEAIEYWDFWAGWIREGNAVQLHPASKVSRLQGAMGGHPRLLLHQLHHLVGCADRCCQRAEHIPQHLHHVTQHQVSNMQRVFLEGWLCASLSHLM